VALVDVQPQKQLGKGSIALAKGLNINANAKRGQTDERIVRYVFCQGAVTWPGSNHSFDHSRSIKSVGWIKALRGDGVTAKGISQDIRSPHNPRLLGGLLHHPLQLAIWFY
jgi:hypothetical protein